MTKPLISLQDLRRRIYAKAKAEPSWRFWGLFVHVCKMETLHEAYALAKKNDGAPGIDGVSFAAIEESGVDGFLEQIRDELVSRRYVPMPNRRKEIPKDGGRKVRVLGIPSIRDRVVQGALKLILEPIFEADFQEGSFGYRPERTAHEAVDRVAEAIGEGKTRVIDLDLRAYFDNVRHHILLDEGGGEDPDDDVLRLLKLILKATGAKGVPQGGVISPLLSNIYLNEVDRMLEKASEVTREGERTRLQYARFADDLVVLVDGQPRHERLLGRVSERLARGTGQARGRGQRREEPNRGPGERGEFRLPGIRFPARPQSQRHEPAPEDSDAEEAHGADRADPGGLSLAPLPAGAPGDREDQPDPPGVGQLLRSRQRQSMLLLRPRLGGEEGEAASGAEPETQRLRLEQVE